jgi:hypothetical protein
MSGGQKRKRRLEDHFDHTSDEYSEEQDHPLSNGKRTKKNNDLARQGNGNDCNSRTNQRRSGHGSARGTLGHARSIRRPRPEVGFMI